MDFGRKLSYWAFLGSFLVLLGGFILFQGKFLAARPWLDISSLLLPFGIYVMAHMLRAVRLSLLLGGPRFRTLLVLYFYVSACSALIPFKLGELVRISEIVGWLNDFWRGLLIVWIERLFDSVAQGIMILLQIAFFGQDPLAVRQLIVVIGAFAFISILFFLVLPEQLYNLNLHIIRSYKGRKAIRLLRIVDSIYEVSQRMRPLLAGKLVSLTLLTGSIWLLELLALASLFNSDPGQQALLSLTGQFTALMSSAPSVTFPASSLTLAFDAMKMEALGGVGLLLGLTLYRRLRLRGLAERPFASGKPFWSVSSQHRRME
ncbi:MAG TPA: hypothetical protein VE954_16425 [Oligoflexus sp.]|uniref:hypothetical protein n=1 Tax=Oligoflexus sp. TaxID=1971216 RepID=UPI002D6742F3|nr:hypothetical protein [Oligoflexus sp.]HYX34685.1 hypothetical protein [Oligoflexus sp.]